MNKTQSWYASLIKPSWAPPAFLFGPVWTVLYILIAVTYIPVLVKVFQGKLPKKVAAPLLLNLLFNFIYSPIQFWLQNNYLAAIDILLVLATTIWVVVTFWRLRKFVWAALLNIPYLLWVSFATVLQLTVTWLNRG